MRIFTDLTGHVVDYRIGSTPDPAGLVFAVELDERANPAIVEATVDMSRLTWDGDMLYRDGQALTINPPGERWAALAAAEMGFTSLPNWAQTMTAQQAADYINGQIWNGMTQAQVEAWIDTNLTNITTANVAQINARLASMRQALKLTAGAVLAMRDLFVMTAKLLVYIRDLVIRFRQ